MRGEVEQPRPAYERAVFEVRVPKAAELAARRRARRDTLLHPAQAVREERLARRLRSAAGEAHAGERRESLPTYRERALQLAFVPPERPPDARALLLEGLEAVAAPLIRFCAYRDTTGAS